MSQQETTIPADAYLGGWNAQVRALEAEVKRLRARVAELEEQVAGIADDMRAADDRSDSR